MRQNAGVNKYIFFLSSFEIIFAKADMIPPSAAIMGAIWCHLVFYFTRPSNVTYATEIVG